MTTVETKSTYSVPPVERALRLMRYIGDGNKARNLSVVSRELGINRTTLIRLIHTLLEYRMIEEVGDGAGYRLGSGMVSLGAQAIQGRDIVQICQPILRDLCQDTGMSAHLGVPDGRDIIYLSRETPNSPLVSNIRAGSRLPIHAASIGRAILAELGDEDIERLFSGEEPGRVTDKTPTTIREIVEQAHADKSKGYAWSQGNFESGIGSCAAAILDHTGSPVGGINVSGPETRFSNQQKSGETTIRDAVLRAAERASGELGYRV